MFKDNIKITLSNIPKFYVSQKKDIRGVQKSLLENCIIRSKIYENKKNYIKENLNQSDEIEITNESCKIHLIPFFKASKCTGKI